MGCGYFGAIGEGTIPSLSGAGVLDILLEIIGSGSIPGFRQPTSAEMQLITYILGAKNLASLTGAGLILLEEGLTGAGVFAQFVQASYGSGATSGGAGRPSLSSRFSSYILKFARE